MTIPRLVVDGPGGPNAKMSLADYARERLVDMIVSLELAPGAAIVERDLLAALRLGRTPVREALQQVVGLGLLCRLPHQGMYVCDVTPQSLREIYELRSIMDGRVAELATRRAQPIQVDAIVAAAKEIEAAYEAKDLRRFTVATRRFADGLASATDNLHIVEMMPRMHTLDARFTWIANQVMGQWDVLGHGIVETSLSLAGVIRRKLPDEARLLAELHIERRYSYLSAQVALPCAPAVYRRRS